MANDAPSIADQWHATRKRVHALFAQLSEDGNGQVVVPADVKTAVAALNDAAWDNNRRVYTFGIGGETDKHILAARAGLIPWWPLQTGAAFSGDLDGLRKIRDAIDKHETDPSRRPGLNSVLTWISMPYTLVGNVRNKPEPAVLHQLMEWGADPNHDGGSWFEKALRSLDRACIEVFLDHGGSFDTVARAMAGADKEVKARISAALTGRSFTTRVGEDTLLRTQFLPDTAGTAVLRTVFNFSAQRVQEIYAGPGTQPVLNTVNFEDYTTAALGEAHEALKQLGGSAPDILRATGKKLVVPAGLKRKPQGAPSA